MPRDDRAADAVRRQAHLLTLYPQARASLALIRIAAVLHDDLAPKDKALQASIR